MKQILILGGLFFTTITPMVAKDATTDSLRHYQLESAQIVGTRAGKRTPMAFTNVTQQQIKSKNIGPDIPYLLSSLPSVTMSSDAGAGIGYTYLRIRGTDPTRINVTANGIPLNDAESNSLYWVNMADFAGSLGSIQVQRGVGTSTNGSGAFGATVNLQTEAMSDAPSLTFNGTAGSYGTHKESIHFTTGMFKEHWGFGGRLTNIGSDGYISGARSSLNSYFLQGGYFGDKTVVKFVTFNGHERTGLAWDYATKSQMQKYGRKYNPLGLFSLNDTTKVRYKDNVDDYHQQHYQLFWNQEWMPELKFNLALHYTKGLGYYEQYKSKQKLKKYGLDSALGQVSDLIRRKYSAADFYGTVFSLNYTLPGLEAIFGGGWNKYDGRHYGKVLWVKNYSGEISPQQQYYRNFAHKQDANIYGRVTYDVLKGLSAYADLQYRYVDYKMYGPNDKTAHPYDEHHHFSFFNPKAGLMWNVAPHHQLYGSWAMAHKEPTRNDYESAASGGNVPKAERLNDFELGYKYRSRNFSAGVNFYYMRYKDQFVLTGEQDDLGEFVAKNVGDSYRRGVELEGVWQPVNWWKWEANLTWSHNRIKDYRVSLYGENTVADLGDTPISFSPNLIANNSFTFLWQGFRAALQTQYVSMQYMTNTGFKTFDAHNIDGGLTLSPYCVTNLDLSYTFTKWQFCKSMTIGATLYNLFNAKYESNGSAAAAVGMVNGKPQAVATPYDDSYSTYSAQAPLHFLVHLSVAF